jgi:hypothetical protein
MADERPLRLIHAWQHPLAPRVERQAHRLLKPWQEWSERFRVGEAVAVAAVEMAIALINEQGHDKPDDKPEYLCPELPAVRHFVGYTPVGVGRSRLGDFLSLRRAGVHPDAIHDDLQAALMDARRGDTFHTLRPGDLPPEVAMELAERGIRHVVV